MHLPSKIDLRIRDSFALTCWADAWAHAREESGRPSSTVTCRDITQQCPPVPPEVLYMVDRYFERLCSDNSCFRPEQLLERAALAEQADAGKLAASVDAFAGAHAGLFGHYLYMEAVGHGAQWTDDHAPYRHVEVACCFGDVQCLALSDEYLNAPLRKG